MAGEASLCTNRARCAIQELDWLKRATITDVEILQVSNEKRWIVSVTFLLSSCWWHSQTEGLYIFGPMISGRLLIA